jgi:hypothetical protein
LPLREKAHFVAETAHGQRFRRRNRADKQSNGVQGSRGSLCTVSLGRQVRRHRLIAIACELIRVFCARFVPWELIGNQPNCAQHAHFQDGKIGPSDDSEQTALNEVGPLIVARRRQPRGGLERNRANDDCRGERYQHETKLPLSVDA